MRDFLKSPLFAALAVTLVCAMLMLTEGVEHVYWNMRYKAFVSETVIPKQESVIVSLDGGEVGGEAHAVASTASQALLLRRILVQQPDHVYFDVPSALGADRAGDDALADAVRQGDFKVSMVLRGFNDSRSETSTFSAMRTDAFPHARFVASAWSMNFFGYAKAAPTSVSFDGRTITTIPASQAGSAGGAGLIYPEFRVAPGSVPVIDSSVVLSDKVYPGILSGKTVYVTTTNAGLGTAIGYYGVGKVPSAVVDIAAVAGLDEGRVVNLGRLPLLTLFVMLILAGHYSRSYLLKGVVYSVVVLTTFVLPAVAFDHRLFLGNDLAIMALAVYVPIRAWRRARRKAELVNRHSGLPNTEALASAGIPDGYDVIAATVEQFDVMLASLPREFHGECTRQIARRLSVASGESKIFVTENGGFVWLEEPSTLEAQTSHLEGLRALFSAPLVIEGQLFDTTIHFGLDRNFAHPSLKRIQTALACANEAMSKGKLYVEYEQQRVAEAPWQLSLHARIDEGLRNGDIWLALQAQYDLRSDCIMGAEALIRWNDPERGAIPPDAFILQAERAGRIEAITYWVLEQSIQASKRINRPDRSGPPIHISVNLSARVADQPGFAARAIEIARQHAFDCTRMTFEVTETFSIENHEEARRNLAGLRAAGFRLSIDDFGTGQASLAYLAEIPSDEIKLDKRFIQSLAHNKRERLIVRTVIKLAHSLGQEVVAEGVEDAQTLAILRRMNCDIAQGYYLGRPIPIAEFEASLDSSKMDTSRYG